MEENILNGLIRLSPEYKSLIARYQEQVKTGSTLPLLVDGVSDGALYSLLFSLISDTRKEKKKPILILVGEERRGAKLNEFLRKAEIKSEFYPVRDFNFYDLTASRDLEHERLRVLSGVLFNSCDAIITTPDALLQYTIPKERLKSSSLSVNLDTSLDILDFSKQLFDMGYSPTHAVEGPGQYSVRGGIIDVFPTKCEYTVGKKQASLDKPIRIELFGDEIDRMATFNLESQRMEEKISSFKITPSKEIVASAEQLSLIYAEIEELLSYATSEDSLRQLSRELTALKTGNTSLSFFDKYISLIYPEKNCLLDYFDEETDLIICDTNAVKAKAKEAEESQNEIAKTLIESFLIPSKYTNFSAPVSLIDDFSKNHITINVDTYLMSRLDAVGGIYHFKTKGTSYANHSIYVISDELDYFAKNDYKAIVICNSLTEAKGALRALSELNIPATILKPGAIKSPDEISSGVISISLDSYPEGYEVTDAHLAVLVLSSRQVRASKKALKNKKLAKSAGERILSHNDLAVGDYVVHVAYGVGKYLGIQNLCVMGAYRDYIAIQYAGTDKLYLPVEQLDMVSKYIGAGSSEDNVRLSKMGGSDWKKSTDRAKKAAKDMAKELIDLYARRTRIDGFAFYDDSLMEEEFASSFEYEETDSQSLAISEVLADMKKPYPMDRVLCGDVGYGKTEVAFRAAMKAVAGNKQVAILVPTTILAMQHYQTAIARFAGTGVNIDMISRFKTTKEQNQTLRSLKRGDLDIIIGTHKLLAKNIEFKDLGLLIIDEEQRFGVAQKEKIKAAWPNVDVLTLSATPIPRTLSMAMGGIRDLSQLDEAPAGRVGVQSYVLEHDESILNDAIKRELHRGGQVFYLINDVDKIYHRAAKLTKDFPGAKVAVGHGQMDKDSLEEIWHKLVLGEIDILVCTTIIETGIDIPNANTLIIENADRMGLAQLHQIRGRVGRSHRRAYAFFTYRRGKELTDVATRRLGAIRDFCEFGAGFKIAMRDLEIRGAGNLLGSEQHGHLDAVGYDLYIKLLNEAVLEEKGEAVTPVLKYETKITTALDAFVPDSYIESAAQRVDVYKKIAHIEEEADLDDVRSELLDRFGKIPRETESLLSIALIKSLASRAKIKKVDILKTEIRFYPEIISLPTLVEVSRYDPRQASIVGVMNRTPYVCLKIDQSEPLYKRAVPLLKFYFEKFTQNN